MGRVTTDGISIGLYLWLTNAIVCPQCNSYVVGNSKRQCGRMAGTKHLFLLLSGWIVDMAQ